MLIDDPSNYREALIRTYLENPCNVLPNALWKTLETLDKFDTSFTADGSLTKQLKISKDNRLMLWWQREYALPLKSDLNINKLDFALLHQDHIANFTTTQFDHTPYFRLIHHHDNIPPLNPVLGFSIRTASPNNENHKIAELINNCYPGMQLTSETILGWVKHPVFLSELWLWVIDESNGKPVALGIAEFDKNIREGSLEWIQVLPEYHGLGLGKWICTELLHRLVEIADFTTVSGEVNNDTHSDILYRKLGFQGEDVWWVFRRKKVK
jgi:ribosomal protein S18 acetylase RimI-like enzyme